VEEAQNELAIKLLARNSIFSRQHPDEIVPTQFFRRNLLDKKTFENKMSPVPVAQVSTGTGGFDLFLIIWDPVRGSEAIVCTLWLPVRT